jgi:predicted permease
MEWFAGDVRYGLRRLRRSPGFSLLVVATLALGIGANTVIFSVVDSVLLRPLPYAEPERLVTIQHRYPGLDLNAPVSAPGFRSYRDETRSFSGLAVQAGWGANLTGLGEPMRVVASRVSAGFFETLGVAAALGRTFRQEEDVRGSHFVVVLSDGLWQRQFGGDPAILGKVINLNAEPYEVIGVMPPGFRALFQRTGELWVPLALTEEQFASGNEYLSVTARLAQGVSLESATAEMARFAETIKSDNPGNYPDDWTLRVTTLREVATGGIRTALLVLLGAVGFVLLIACANVANLLLVRATSRAREAAVRLAMGARRWHLARQLLAESVLLSLAGGIAGTALAWVGIRGLAAVIDTDRLLGQPIALDGSVYAFTALVAVATGVLFGLAPALQASRGSVRDAMEAGGRGGMGDRGGQLLRKGFVVAEFGLALTLLAGAGLLVRSFARIQAVDPGFDADNTLTFGITLPPAEYPNDTVRAAFFDAVLARIAAVPGVLGAGSTSVLPFGGSWSTSSFTVEGYTVPDGGVNPWGDIRIVSDGFAEALRIPIVAGRFFDSRDRDGSTAVTVVDEELVRRYWPDQDPIGKRITFDDPTSADAEWIEVIGVVGHTAHEGLDADPRVQVYFSYRQANVGGSSIVVRTRGEPLAALAAVTAAVREVDPDLPLAGPNTMARLVRDSTGQRRLAVVLLGVFAFIGLLLAATGIYGVMSQMVSQRAKEMGLRMALGAGIPSVLGLVVRQGMVLAGLGTGLGVAGALALTRVLETQLFEVRATDPATLVGVTALLAGVGLVATLIPALRAARLDPVTTLRQE